MNTKIIAVKEDLKQKEIDRLTIANDALLGLLEDVENNLRAIGANTTDIICRMSLEGKVKWFSKSIGKMGYSMGDLVGRNIWDYIHREDAERLQARIQRFIDDKEKHWEGIDTFRFQHKSGEWHWIEAGLTATPHSIVCIARDITERRKVEESLLFNAYHDPLTKLPNRMLLNDRLVMAIDRAKRRRKAIILMYLDLDGFKPVNDFLGHDEGDRYLKEIAKAFTENFRCEDTIARVGGDEFVFVFSDIEPNEIKEKSNLIADKILYSISLVPSSVLKVSGSIGISVFPKNGITAEDLIQQADKAMYHSKRNGKSKFSFVEDVKP